MRAIMTGLVIMTLGVVLACDDAPSPTSATASLQVATGDLIALLPDRTLAAVEFHDLAARWDELRAIAPLARAQDRLLNEIGLDADDVEEIAGASLVVALVADPGWRQIVPVAVLDPPSHERALARLGRKGELVAVEERGAVWTGPADHTQLLERISAGDGTSFRQAVDFAAVDERLPEGGLVRVVLHPPALGEYLRSRAEMAATSLAGRLAGLLHAHFEAIEMAAFRRDVVGGEIVTDGWVGFDTQVIPEAFKTALATHRGPATLPSDLPGDVLLAGSFRTEAEAGLAYLRSLAARDPRGPLRNLDFWIAEFEARTRRDVERDIVGALGDRVFTFVLEGKDDGGGEVVAIFEARDPARLEAALVDLADWLAEHVRGRSLNLTIPRRWDAQVESGVEHGIDVWRPFTTVSGPVFQIVDGHLVIACSRGALRRGVELATSLGTWSTPAWALEGEGPADEIAWIRTPALARLLADPSASAASDGAHLLGAVWDLLEASGEGRVVVRYEEYGFHLSGHLRIDG